MPRAERRRQLLQVARGVFAERGFEAATLEEIAEEAGVSRPILYDHFGDKQGLFEGVVRDEIARVQAIVSEAIAPAEREPRQLVEAGIRAFFTWVGDHPDGHAVLTRDAPVHLSDSGLGMMLDELSSRITAAVADGLARQGLDPAPAPLYANALIGLCVHVGRWWRQRPEVPLDAVTRHTTALVWSGFAGLPDDPGARAPLTARRGRR